MLVIQKDDKRGVTGGLVTGLIFGVAALVIGVIIAFVVVQTLTDSNLLNEGRATATVNFEFFNLNGTTNHTLTTVNSELFRTGFSIVAIMNATNNVTISSANYTIVSSEGIVYLTDAGKAGDGTAGDVWTNYTYETKTSEEVSTERLTSNFTAGVDNVSDKIPTVLLIAAVVLILGVLGILVLVWQRMRLGGGTTI